MSREEKEEGGGGGGGGGGGRGRKKKKKKKKRDHQSREDESHKSILKKTSDPLLIPLKLSQSKTDPLSHRGYYESLRRQMWMGRTKAGQELNDSWETWRSVAACE